MRTIPLTHSLLQHWEQLTYLEAALLAHPEAAPLAQPVTETLESFPAIRDLDLQTRRTIVQARAHGSVADAGLDEALREVHSNTLHLTRQDRSAKHYRSLFPNALAAHIRHALARQVEVTRETRAQLQLSLYEQEFRAEQEALLDPALEAGEGALEERKSAEFARVEGRMAVDAWKEEVNAVRLSVYAQLLTLAAKARRKRSWANSFFPTPPRRSSARAFEELEQQDEPALEPEA